MTRPQAGLSRRPSSEDLFADESLFARLDEPPASAEKPAASLGFEPAPLLDAPTSATSIQTAAVTADRSEADTERQNTERDVLPFNSNYKQRELGTAAVVGGGKDRR